MEPPLSPPADGTTHVCPQCRALIIGRLPTCPQCGQTLTYGGMVPGSVRASSSEEFGCLKAIAAATLIIIAPVAALVGAVFVIAGAQGSDGHSSDLSLLGIGIMCLLIATGCVTGIVALFRKQS